jgi:hypothetical protein
MRFGFKPLRVIHEADGQPYFVLKSSVDIVDGRAAIGAKSAVYSRSL